MCNHQIDEYLFIIYCDREVWYLVKCTYPQIYGWIGRLNATESGRWSFEETDISPKSVVDCRVNRLELQHLNVRQNP